MKRIAGLILIGVLATGMAWAGPTGAKMMFPRLMIRTICGMSIEENIRVPGPERFDKCTCIFCISLDEIAVQVKVPCISPEPGFFGTNLVCPVPGTAGRLDGLLGLLFRVRMSVGLRPRVLVLSAAISMFLL